MIINKDGKRQKIEEVLDILMKYDVISFDIFDTLILRPFSAPYDLFKFLGMRYSLSNFTKVRIAASKNSRDRFKHREVLIDDIYKEVNTMTNINTNDGVRLEFEAEKNLCYANSYMLKIFNTLLEKGKEVIIISDMYYPKNMMIEILDKCNIKGYKNLYISCDYKKSKKNHELFKMVASKYKNNEKIIHIGDTYESDIQGSISIGWDAYYYPKTICFDNEIIKYKMSYNIRSVYNALIQNRFHNGIEDEKTLDKKYYYGYSIGGILALGYTKWIHDIAKNEGYQKVFFLSRDGYILKKVYDYLYDDIPSEYLYWSRHASIKTCLDRDLSYYIFQFIERRLNSGQRITIEDMLKDAELDFLLTKINDYSLNKNQYIDKKSCDIIINLIKDNIDEIRKISLSYKKATKKILLPMLKDCSKILIVDIGWKGSSITSLKYLIEEVWNLPIKVIGALVGNYAYKKGYDTSMLYNGDLRVFSFSENLNSDYAFIHQKNIEISNTIVETLFSAPHPSFIKYKINNKNKVYPIFSNISENLEDVEIVQDGIFDFVVDYKTKMTLFEEALNISGRDAYTPIIFMLENKNKMNDFIQAFNNYQFTVTVGGLSQSGEEISRSLPDMINKLKLKKSKHKIVIKKMKKTAKRIIKKIKKTIR